MKVFLCVVWILISSSIACKAIDSDKGWLAVPAIISTILAVIMFIVELILSILSRC